MATSRRRTAKKNLGQNLNDLDRRLKTVERRPRSGVDAWSITADMLAPGLITLDKLSPELLALLQQTYSSGDSTGDTTEEQGYGLTDALIASAEYSTNAANGKNSLFFSPTAPDEGTYLVDDIWYDTSIDTTDGRPKYTPYQWDGDSWEPAPFSDAAFRFLNAGKIATGTLDAAQIIRVGQYPTPEGKTRLEISGGNGIITTTTTLVNAVTATSTTFIVSSATGMPSSGVFTIKVDYGLPTEELVTVTSRSGTTLTVVRGATDSIPFAHAAGAEVQYSSPVYAGITVLKNPVGSGITVTNEAGQASLPALFRLDASEGSLLIQEGDDYLKFNTSDSLGRLSISGQLLVGTGSESVAVGPNISGQQDGIRLGPFNWWYRPSSTLAEYPSGAIFFKVGSSDTGNLISAHTNGTVTIEGTVNPTAGVVKGKLSIRDIAGAVDRIEIGQNVLTNRDGIRIDANNHWTISNTGGSAAFSVGSATKSLTYDTVTGLLKLVGGDIELTGGGSFKTSDNNTRVEMNSNGIFGYTGGTKTFWVDAATGDSSFEGTTNPTGGTVKGKLTIQGTTYAFGKTVMTSPDRDGLYLNANNYWVLSATGGSATFRVGGTSKALSYNSATETLTISADTISINSGDIGTLLSFKADATGSAILSLVNSGLGTGVVMTNAGQIYSAGKTSFNSSTAGWYLGYDSGTPKFGIGNSSKYMRWDGAALNINGQLVGGTTVGSGTGVVVDDSGTYSGINVNNVLRLTGYGGTGNQYGSIVFSDSSAANEKGSVFDSALNKYTVTYSGGRGIAMGSSSFYPFIEAGYDSLTGTTNPRIRLQAGANSYLQFNAANFTLSAGSTSSIIGIPTPSGASDSASKVLGKDSNGYLAWYTPGSGSGSGSVTSVGLAAPSGFSVSGSPVTGSGTLTLSFGTVGSSSDYSSVLRTGSAGGVNWGKVTGDYIPTSTTITTSGFYHVTGTREAWYGGAFASASVPAASTFPANALVVVF